MVVYPALREANETTDADLPQLYDACLIFLYRLLFILYAEGRQLLPVEPKSRRYYKELSLTRLIPDLKSFSAYDSRTQRSSPNATPGTSATPV